MFLDLSTIQNNILGQFILPFVLFFAVAYGSLRTAAVFKDMRVNSIIAAVISLMAASYAPLVTALFQYMPYVFIVLLILFSYNLISTLLKGKQEGAGAQSDKAKLDVVIVIGIMLVILNAVGADNLSDLPGIDGKNLVFILALVAVYAIVKSGYGKAPENK